MRRGDGSGYLVDASVEVRLLGRVRLLTIDAAVVIAEDGSPPSGLAAPASPASAVVGRAHGASPLAPGPRLRLAEATDLLRDARADLELASRTVGVVR